LPYIALASNITKTENWWKATSPLPTKKKPSKRYRSAEADSATEEYRRLNCDVSDEEFFAVMSLE
jgi:hypothetical protein